MATQRKQDRRTMETQRRLMQAFIDLLLSRGYDAFSPSDIAREAGVTRSTLYLHFRGKDALLSAVLRPRCATLASCVDSTIEMDELVALLAHFHGQRRLNAMFFRDPLRALWVDALRREVALRLRRGRRAGGVAVAPVFMAVSIAEMQVGLLTHWLRRMPHVSPEIIAGSLREQSVALAGAAIGRPD